MQSIFDVPDIDVSDPESYESRHKLRGFPLGQGKPTVLNIMREFYGLHSDNDGRRPFNQSRLRYRGNGCWFKRRDNDGNLVFEVEVGCSHEWDCCGCLCGLSHTFRIVADVLIVITSSTYNY